MPDDEVLVHPRTPLPHGYTFVPKGNVYLTAHCRRKTHAQGCTVYVVSSPKKILGLRCPTAIVDAVRAAEQATRAARHDATAKRDAALATTFREALLARYPAVPADTVPQIVQHALTKHARRVARTSTLDEAARVRLAVRAHIRHRWTDYEAILRQDETTKTIKGKTKGRGKGKGRRDGKLQRRRRAEARALTVGRVNAIEREWSGKSGQSRKGSVEGEEASIDDESSASDDSDDGDEGDDSDEEEREDIEHKEHKSSAKGRDCQSGKGAGITVRKKDGSASKVGKDINVGKVAGNDRVRKTATTTTLRKARSSKSQATARIARRQQQLQAASGDNKEEAIVIDSDSDWTP